MTARCVTLAIVVTLAAPRSAAAQTVDRPVHRFEATIGGLWLGGGELGSEDADLRRSGTPPGDFAVFATDTSVEVSPGFDGRIAYWLTRSIAVEAGVVMTRPVVSTRVSGDIEDAEDLTL